MDNVTKQQSRRDTEKKECNFLLKGFLLWHDFQEQGELKVSACTLGGAFFFNDNSLAQISYLVKRISYIVLKTQS